MSSPSIPNTPNVFGRTGARYFIALLAVAGSFVIREALERGLGQISHPSLFFIRRSWQWPFGPACGPGLLPP